MRNRRLDVSVWLRRASCVTAFASAGIAACSDSSAPAQSASLDVLVGSDSVASTRRFPWGRFTVEVTLRNRSDQWLTLVGCAPSLEREVAPGQWQSALEPVCALSTAEWLRLPPQSDLSRSEEIMGSLSASAGPEFLGDVLTGRFRLLYRYAPDGYEGLVPLARSAPFDVTD